MSSEFGRRLHPRSIGGGAVSALEAVCTRCGARDEVTSTGRPMPPEVVAKKFTERGWRIARTGSRHRCPQCVSKKGSGMEPKNSKPLKIVASEPRQPERAEKRRIVDALDEHYDTSAELYREAWSDAKVADALKVPRAWVEMLRRDLYGDCGENKLTREDRKKLSAAADKAELAAEKALKAAGDAEAAAKACREISATKG